MKKAIIIGKSGSGKTTLVQRLENKALEYKKTQTIQHYLNFIDTPGEYLERRGMYRAFLVHAADADVVGLVQECCEDNTWLPPSFAGTFGKPVFGIVTKADLAQGEDDIDFAREILERSGVEEIFVVSSIRSTGLEPLLEYLNTDE